MIELVLSNHSSGKSNGLVHSGLYFFYIHSKIEIYKNVLYSFHHEAEISTVPSYSHHEVEISKKFKYLSGHKLWLTHIAHSPSPTQKRNFYPKIFLSLPKKRGFSLSKTKFLILSWRNFLRFCDKKQIFHMKYNFLKLPEKAKNFLYLSEKLIFYTFMEKSKGFISDAFLTWVCNFLSLYLWSIFIFHLL